MPITETDTINFGARYEHTKLSLLDQSPPVYLDFANRFGLVTDSIIGSIGVIFSGFARSLDVVAHELAHVKHRDILISSVAATLAVASFAAWGFALVATSGTARKLSTSLPAENRVPSARGACSSCSSASAPVEAKTRSYRGLNARS